MARSCSNVMVVMLRHHRHAFKARPKSVSSVLCKASWIDFFLRNRLSSVTGTLVNSVLMPCENIEMTEVVLDCIKISMHAANSQERRMAPQRMSLSNVRMSG